MMTTVTMELGASEEQDAMKMVPSNLKFLPGSDWAAFGVLLYLLSVVIA